MKNIMRVIIVIVLALGIISCTKTISKNSQTFEVVVKNTVFESTVEAGREYESDTEPGIIEPLNPVLFLAVVLAVCCIALFNLNI